MTTEAMTGSGAGPYQITNSAKQVWDVSVGLDFFDNGVAVSAGDILAIDDLFGKVTFTGSKTGPITVTGSYWPLVTVAEGRSVDLTVEADELDDTVFGDSWSSSMQGLKRVTGSIESLALLTDDMDSGAGTLKASTLFTNGTPFVLSVRPGGTGDYYRFYAILLNVSEAVQVEDLERLTIAYTSVTVTRTDPITNVTIFSNGT
jgi:hypothetical protein